MIRVESPRDQVNVAKVYEAGQEQIFKYWDELDSDQRVRLLEQLALIDFQELARLVRGLQDADEAVARDLENLSPPKMIGIPRTPEEEVAHKRAGEAGLECFERGEVGVFLVAGGQGTRLRFEGPKGLYPIAPITQKTLFQLFAEQILAMQRRCKRSIPWFIMTSQLNHEATKTFFQENQYFGLNPGSVMFQQQGMLPVVDHRRGKILLEDRDTLALSPNGHGGAAGIIRGLEEKLSQLGVRHLMYHQVDNPLLRVCDPVFLGYHVLAESQFSSKAIAKRDPGEKIGIFCGQADQTIVVEYSELRDREREARDPDGQLTFRAGNVASHVISVDFLCPKDGSTGFDMPYHHAYKATPHIRNGERVDATEPNAVKFESFLFDVLPHAQNPVVLEVDRIEEFAPVKNLEGDDTPESCRSALTEKWARWLEQSGVAVPRDADQSVLARIEISSLFADSTDELRGRLKALASKGEAVEVDDQLHLE